MVATVPEPLRKSWNRRGGVVTYLRYGREYYQELARKGAAARWGKADA